MFVPPDLYARLCAALRRETDEDLPLPALASFDTVYRIEAYSYRGSEARGGWSVRFLISHTPQPRLDFYAVGDDYSKHRRIDADGRVSPLENYQGQFGRRVYPGDPERTAREHERIDAHNAHVSALLRAKGFEP